MYSPVKEGYREPPAGVVVWATLTATPCSTSQIYKGTVRLPIRRLAAHTTHSPVPGQWLAEAGAARRPPGPKRSEWRCNTRYSLNTITHWRQTPPSPSPFYQPSYLPGTDRETYCKRFFESFDSSKRKDGLKGPQRRDRAKKQLMENSSVSYDRKLDPYLDTGCYK